MPRVLIPAPAVACSLCSCNAQAATSSRNLSQPLHPPSSSAPPSSAPSSSLSLNPRWYKVHLLSSLSFPVSVVKADPGLSSDSTPYQQVTYPF